MWICCKCQAVTEDYPNNRVCSECGNEDDFEEIEEEEEK